MSTEDTIIVSSIFIVVITLIACLTVYFIRQSNHEEISSSEPPDHLNGHEDFEDEILSGNMGNNNHDTINDNNLNNYKENAL